MIESIEERKEKVLNKQIIIPANSCLSPIDQLLLCIVCKNIPQEPKYCIICDALVCSPCIEIITPSNVNSYNSGHSPRHKLIGCPSAIQNLLLDPLEFKCKNSPPCEERPSYCEYIQHINNCTHALVECPIPSCPEQLPLRSIRSHRAICMYQEVECKNKEEGCEWRGRRMSEELHKERCGYKSILCTECGEGILLMGVPLHKGACKSTLVNCKWCGEELRRGDLPAHICKRSMGERVRRTGEILGKVNGVLQDIRLSLNKGWGIYKDIGNILDGVQGEHVRIKGSLGEINTLILSASFRRCSCGMCSPGVLGVCGVCGENRCRRCIIFCSRCKSAVCIHCSLTCADCHSILNCSHCNTPNNTNTTTNTSTTINTPTQSQEPPSAIIAPSDSFIHIETGNHPKTWTFRPNKHTSPRSQSMQQSTINPAPAQQSSTNMRSCKNCESIICADCALLCIYCNQNMCKRCLTDQNEGVCNLCKVKMSNKNSARRQNVEGFCMKYAVNFEERNINLCTKIIYIYIYIGGKNIDDKYAKHVAMLIQDNKYTKILSLMNNKFTEKGIKLISQALTNNKTLETLSLGMVVIIHLLYIWSIIV